MKYLFGTDDRCNTVSFNMPRGASPFRARLTAKTQHASLQSASHSLLDFIIMCLKHHYTNTQTYIHIYISVRKPTYQLHSLTSDPLPTCYSHTTRPRSYSSTLCRQSHNTPTCIFQYATHHEIHGHDHSLSKPTCQR